MNRSSLLNSLGRALLPLGPAVNGYIDQAQHSTLNGWVSDLDPPEKRLNVDAYLGSKIVGSAVANQRHPLLALAEIGDGRSGFPSFLQPRARRKVRSTIHFKVPRE